MLLNATLSEDRRDYDLYSNSVSRVTGQIVISVK